MFIIQEIAMLKSRKIGIVERIIMRLNTGRLRCMIGWLGMTLPWIVVLLIKYFPQSISATWYTNACTVFMIILGSAGLLLISYKGYEPIDDITLTLSGIAGLGICLFPCHVDGIDGKVGTFLINAYVSNIIHCVCAFIFFGLLSYNSMFLFTKTSDSDNVCAVRKITKKQIRNIIYRICAIGMMASFLLLLLPNFSIKVWLVETIALFFFGISWLTKANRYKWLFCDTKENNT